MVLNKHFTQCNVFWTTVDASYMGRLIHWWVWSFHLLTKMKTSTALSCNESRQFTADNPWERPRTRLHLARVWAENSTVLSLPMGGATRSLWTPPWGLAECLWAPGLSGPPSSAPDVFLNYNTHHEPQEELELCWASVLRTHVWQGSRLQLARGSLPSPPISPCTPHLLLPTPSLALSPSAQKKQSLKTQIFWRLWGKTLTHFTSHFFGGWGGVGWVEVQNTVTKPNFLKRQAFFFLCYLSELARLQ